MHGHGFTFTAGRGTELGWYETLLTVSLLRRDRSWERISFQYLQEVAFVNICTWLLSWMPKAGKLDFTH